MRFRFQKPDKSIWWTLLYCILLPVYLELTLHLFVYHSLTARVVYPLLFALAISMIFFILTSVFPPKVNRILAIVLTVLVVLYFEIQFVYNSIFGEFMSIWEVSIGADAVTNFWHQMLYGIWKVILKIIVLLLPIPAVSVLVGRKVLSFPRISWQYPACAAVLFFAFHYAALGVMLLNNRGSYSAFRLYTNSGTATEISVKNIGLLSTTRLECKYVLFREKPTQEETVTYPAETAEVEIEEKKEDTYNMLDLDFDKLASSTSDSALKKLDAYFAGVKPTSKNKYTGALTGYNLITICAESFSPYLIDETRTPALYKLSHNGFIFNNYYGTFGSNTTNGEYALCMGLYPDLSREKSVASFYASRNNSLPFCLGNEFKSEGVQTWAYHNYSGEYYSRNVTHPNMGYTFKSATDGLDIPLSWPSSDLDLMKASVDDYITSGDQFCAYYMTFSGHYQYNWDNPMSAKNKAVTDALPYSDTVKAYIACNMELEYAMEYLLQRLDEAGIADNTVIVLTNDHYPYGLTESEYNELAGKTIDTTFEKYHNKFICYVPGMQVPVDTYCSTVDILPTLLNLFGFSYDSRLLVGRDVFSPEALNAAVLSDQSFVTADYGFDASSGEIKTFSDAAPDDAAVEALQKQIALNFQVSTDILNNDYYAHAVLGRSQTASATTTDKYKFTDLPETLTLAALDYVYDNKYMLPVSETEFGFQNPCTYAEFLNVLYMIAGSPDEGDVTSVYVGWNKAVTGQYAPAVKWAKEQNLISPAVTDIGDDTIVTRRNVAVTLRRYAASRGFDVSVDDDDLAQYESAYPTLSKEEIQSMAWAYHHSVMRAGGSVDSACKTADMQMNRFYIVSAVYNFNLYFVENNPEQ
jgi:lipoteichoic acid synthase